MKNTLSIRKSVAFPDTALEAWNNNKCVFILLHILGDIPPSLRITQTHNWTRRGLKEWCAQVGFAVFTCYVPETPNQLFALSATPLEEDLQGL